MNHKNVATIKPTTKPLWTRTKCECDYQPGQVLKYQCPTHPAHQSKLGPWSSNPAAMKSGLRPNWSVLSLMKDGMAKKVSYKPTPKKRVRVGFVEMFVKNP